MYILSSCHSTSLKKIYDCARFLPSHALPLDKIAFQFKARYIKFGTISVYDISSLIYIKAKVNM